MPVVPIFRPCSSVGWHVAIIKPISWPDIIPGEPYNLPLLGGTFSKIRRSS